jgi:hypothetical protein
MGHEIPNLLDLDRFPIDRPDSDACVELVERCKAMLARDGMFNLDGFVRAQVIARAAEELTPLTQSVSFHQSRAHNVYFLKSIPGVPDDHPALATAVTSSHTLCDDQMPDSIIHAIYEWQPLADFLARVMEKPQLFLMDDPLARVNVMSYSDGEGLGWHFDRSEFTTTLLIQSPLAGGEFEYRTDLRSDDDPNLDGVARLLAGDDPEQKALRLSPGTLNIFKGKNTLHGVSPTQGERNRLIAVFSYYERPGVMFNDDERLGFYGRTVA